MKIKIEDDFDGRIHEFEIPEDLYEKAYNQDDKAALYEIALIVDNTQELSDLPVVDMMSEAWDNGDGCELAGVWLDEYYEYDHDDKYDAWA